MKKALITQSNYIPWKGYFDGINQSDIFVVFDDMQYTKRDWRNRNQIKTPQGLKWLSIPVEVKGKYFQKINETKIADKNWPIEHWNIIQQNYKNSACFKEMSEWIEPLYKNCSFDFLTDVNLSFIQAINQFLDINTEIRFSSEFDLHEEKTQRLVNLCMDVKASDYYSGPAAKAYMDESKFADQNIKVHYFDYSGYDEYPQLFGEFEHGVCILDLIFNVGNEASKYLKMNK